jgi:hypothetical protein
MTVFLASPQARPDLAIVKTSIGRNHRVTVTHLLNPLETDGTILRGRHFAEGLTPRYPKRMILLRGML